MKNLKTRIAIDDFGTGYSNLNRPNRFPVYTLKIDKSFVQNIVNDSDYAAITINIIMLVHSMHMKVVAERAETAAQLEFFKLNECEEYQGFWSNQPIPARAIEVLLGNQRAEMLQCDAAK